MKRSFYLLLLLLLLIGIIKVQSNCGLVLLPLVTWVR